MIVGEPSLMGCEMDDEDERFITRLENTQYDLNSVSSSQYHSPMRMIPQGYQQNPHLQSLLHKQQYVSNCSQLLNPNQIKREQMSFPGSPQQQKLPSMFSNNSSVFNGTNAPSNVLLPSLTPVNGELLITGKKISSTNNNSPQTPSANNPNQV